MGNYSRLTSAADMRNRFTSRTPRVAGLVLDEQLDYGRGDFVDELGWDVAGWRWPSCGVYQRELRRSLAVGGGGGIPLSPD